jgi:ADP-ribose pyrophosphatase
MHDTDPLLCARSFQIVRRTAVSPGGQEHSRTIVRHPGAAVILPLLGDGRIVLIRNFRVTAGRPLVELPAGTLDPGEAPIQAAHRELAEETGYRAGSMEPLVKFYSSPGVFDEVMHLFVAADLAEGPADLQHGEEIRTLAAPWHEALAMLRDGRIEDGKTIVALLYYLQFRT